MIAFLQGRLREKRPNRIVLDVHGVGYEVHVPLSTYYGVGEPGAELQLRIHTHVREDALVLFGFATELEQSIFARLLSISGIGPKLALSVLSGIEPLELLRAVRESDVARLTAIPGVGKKTADRIAFELKQRLPAALPGEDAAAPEPASGMRGDLLSALVNLGYPLTAAETAVDRTLKASGDLAFDAALRQVLRELTKR